MIAFFYDSGTNPTENSCVYKMASGLAMLNLKRLNNSGGRQSGPAERLAFRFRTARDTQPFQVEVLVCTVLKLEYYHHL